MENFDSLMQDMDGLENEKSPFRLVFGFIKLLLKMFMLVITWWIKSLVKMMKWLMQRNQPKLQPPQDLPIAR